jgi:hypothetical protein
MCDGRARARIYNLMVRNLVLFCALGVMAFADGVAGIEWTRPASWKDLGSRPMRAANYSVPPAAGDTDAGECVAFFFGEGQGGSADANVKRWEGQFADAAGKPVQATNVKLAKIAGLRVTTLEVAGTYSGMGGPMAQSKTLKPGYRLLGRDCGGPRWERVFQIHRTREDRGSTSPGIRTYDCLNQGALLTFVVGPGLQPGLAGFPTITRRPAGLTPQ